MSSNLTSPTMSVYRKASAGTADTSFGVWDENSTRPSILKRIEAVVPSASSSDQVSTALAFLITSGCWVPRKIKRGFSFAVSTSWRLIPTMARPSRTRSRRGKMGGITHDYRRREAPFAVYYSGRLQSGGAWGYLYTLSSVREFDEMRRRHMHEIAESKNNADASQIPITNTGTGQLG